MDREIVSKTLGSIGSALQQQRGGSVSTVEIYHNGIYHRYKGKERLEAVLQKALLDKFKLTKVTPVRSGQI